MSTHIAMLGMSKGAVKQQTAGVPFDGQPVKWTWVLLRDGLRTRKLAVQPRMDSGVLGAK